MQQYFPNPQGPMNALSQGAAMGRGMRDTRYRQEVGNALAGGDYKGAAQTAAQYGRTDDMMAIQQQVAQMDDRQRSQAREKLQLTARFALGLKNISPDQRALMAQQYAPQLGLDPQMIASLDLSDNAIDAFVTSQVPIMEALGQQNAVRKMDQGDFANQTSRMNARTGRMNAETAKYKAENPTAQEAAQGVQSKFTNEAGEVMLVMRDGSVRGTGQSEKNPYQITDIGGVKTAVDRRTGQRTEITSADETAANAGQIAAEKSRQTALGKSQGESEVNLSQSLADAQKGLKLIAQLTAHDSFDAAYGATTYIPAIRGTGRADVEAMRDQLGGQAFLEAFESLKGGGHITEIEGQKATQAVTRAIDPKQSPAAAREAWQEFSGILKRGMTRAQQRAGATPGINGPSPVGDSVDDLLNKYGVQ